MADYNQPPQMKSSMMSPEDRQAHKKMLEAHIKRFEKLESDRRIWESHWQECMDFIQPRKNDVTSTRQPGDKRNTNLFDTTAIQSNQLLSAALHGMLTNPTTNFFELIFGDPKLDDDESVKAWLQVCGHRMFTVLNNSNFQTEVHEIYQDLGAIGTACMFIAEHPEKIVHFNARAMKEIYIDENNLGLIDTVYRKFSWKARQIVQEFGEANCPEEVMKAYRNGDDQTFCIIHCVYVDKDESAGPVRAKVFPIRSLYILKEEIEALSDKGFKEFPYAVPRWTKTSGEIYGRGPGMEMLPDIKMLNSMMETVIRGAQKTVDPPLTVDDDGVIGRVRLTPGGLTVKRAGSDPIKPLITDARIDFGIQMVDGIRNQVRRGFFVDQLQLQQGPQMTATEVSQRAEESLRLMGPVVGRQNFEFLRPIIERVFGIMARRGLFPPAPSQIQGKSFDVRYSSLIARAQRMNEGNTLMRAISVAAPIVQSDPKALDNLNSDEAVKYVFDVYGVPAKLLRNDRDIQKLRDSRAQAQQIAAQQQMEAHQAEVAGKVLPGAAQVMSAQQRQNQGG